MANTVIGVYDNFAQAQSALKQLLASGFSSLEVRLQPSEDTTAARESALRSAGLGGSGSDSEQSGGLRHFFQHLFGEDTHSTDAHPADHYAEAVRRGSFVLTAEARSEQQRDSAAAIMEQFQPIDVDQRAAQWQATGWQRHDAAAAPLSEEELSRERSRYATAGSGTTGGSKAGSAGEQEAIPVIEEQLKVGKREVQRGGVRVVQRIVETPVQESVSLRQEHVTIERRAVDQPATAADIDAMKEETIELREVGEEAVVAKTARVVEEVVIGKEVTQETATISDTVRRTDVEVEQLGATGAGTNGAVGSGVGMRSTIGQGAMDAGAIGDSAYRSHWQSAYGSSGGSYDEYAPAYQYGAGLRSDQRYTNQDWSASEPAIRQQWEGAHPGSAWDKVKDAVRYGWDKVAH